MSRPISEQASLEALETLLVDARQTMRRPVAVLLSDLSSNYGLPDWRDALSAVTARMGLSQNGKLTSDYFEEFRRLIATGGDHWRRSFWTAYHDLFERLPSAPSYDHLANLLVDRHFDVVATAGWDPLLTSSVSRLLRPDEVRVLVRGLNSDAEIARAIRGYGCPTVVHLAGTLETALFGQLPSREGDQLIDSAFNNVGLHGLVTFGSSYGGEGLLGTIDLKTFAGSEARAATNPPIGRRLVVPYSDFSNVISQLNLRQLRAQERRSSRSPDLLQEELTTGLELGASSIPFAVVGVMVERFAALLEAINPDALAYVHDPLAPGGSEVVKRLAKSGLSRLPQIKIFVASESDSRIHSREVRIECPPELSPSPTIAVIDSIAFSGNTLQKSIAALSDSYPQARPIPAVLVASRNLLRRQRQGVPWLASLLYERTTDRHDLTFPWGTTYSTETVERTLAGSYERRVVKIFRRPWGSGEIFADQENCSVRILSVDAHQKLSFQRHVCRDELFVAMDNETGFDLSGAEFGDSPPANELDARIESVSLQAGDYLLIPRGVWHRARAGRNRVRLLEVAFGLYDEDLDIERVLDVYGREDYLK